MKQLFEDIVLREKKNRMFRKLRNAMDISAKHCDMIDQMVEWFFKCGFEARDLTIDNHLPLIISKATWQKTVYFRTALSREALKHFTIVVINNSDDICCLIGLDAIEDHLKNVRASMPGKYYFVHNRANFYKSIDHVPKTAVC